MSIWKHPITSDLKRTCMWNYNYTASIQGRPSFITLLLSHSGRTPFHQSCAESCFLSCCLRIGTCTNVSFAHRIANIWVMGSYVASPGACKARNGFGSSSVGEALTKGIGEWSCRVFNDGRVTIIGFWILRIISIKDNLSKSFKIKTNLMSYSTVHSFNLVSVPRMKVYHCSVLCDKRSATGLRIILRRSRCLGYDNKNRSLMSKSIPLRRTVPAIILLKTETNKFPPSTASESLSSGNETPRGTGLEGLYLAYVTMKVKLGLTNVFFAHTSPPSAPNFFSFISRTQTPVLSLPSAIVCCIGAGPR